jgi:hypothetical protein
MNAKTKDATTVDEYISMFHGVPFNMETRLEVDDKANSAWLLSMPSGTARSR